MSVELTTVLDRSSWGIFVLDSVCLQRYNKDPKAPIKISIRKFETWKLTFFSMKCWFYVLRKFWFCYVIILFHNRIRRGDRILRLYSNIDKKTSITLRRHQTVSLPASKCNTILLVY